LLIRTDKANELDNQHKNKNNWNWTNKSLQLNTTQQNTIQYNTIPTNQPTNQPTNYYLNCMLSSLYFKWLSIWFDLIGFGLVEFCSPCFLIHLSWSFFLLDFILEYAKRTRCRERGHKQAKQLE
jgi:hypothetical protein